MKKSVLQFLFALIIFNSLSGFSQTNINISNTSAFEGEPYLAVNPVNPRNMVISWMSDDLSTGFKVAIKTKTSTNGGTTWGNQVIHPHFGTTWHSADASMQFRNDILYLSYIDYTESPDSGGVYITHSVNNGITWSTPTQIFSIVTDDPTKKPLDRPWLAIDNSNAVTGGKFYVTTKPPSWINPPNRPYLKVSSDSGQTWKPYRCIDTTNYLVGNSITQPMAAPTVAADGALCIAYPSYVVSQSVYPKYLFAKSYNAGASFQYYDLLVNPKGAADPNYKKGYCLTANPTNANQLAFAYIDSVSGDPDVHVTTTNNGGSTWNTPVRVNDDALGNGKAQDMVWASYSENGDLLLSWRDRRNGAGSGYYQSSDFYCAVSTDNGTTFLPNIRLSTVTAAYNTILASDGNDFMCSKLANDTIYAAWGDVRTGNLNIFFAKTPAGLTTNITTNKGEQLIRIFPNPTNDKLFITIKNKELKQVVVSVFNQLGQEIMNKQIENASEQTVIDISQLVSGIYFVRIKANKLLIYDQKIILAK